MQQIVEKTNSAHTHVSPSGGFILTPEQDGPQIMSVPAVGVQCDWHHASLTLTINLCVAFFGQWIENKAPGLEAKHL